jgi:ABC-type Fe3+ transport system permease subunit
MPGPVLGLGMKGLLSALLGATGEPAWLAAALWHGPSYLPVLWVDLVRFTPCAVALVWPAVRLVPRDLIEQVRLDSGSALAELVRVVWPLTRGAVLRAALAVTVLSLGELGAGKLVATPGADTYAQDLFAQMHYGVSADLAARALLLLGAVAVPAVVVGLWRRQ